MSYAGPFSLCDRDKMIDSWMRDIRRQNIPSTENSDVVDAVVDANTVCAAVFYRFCSLLNYQPLKFNVFHSSFMYISSI